MIRGGYSADFSTWNPDASPATLDAQGRGRVLYFASGVNPIVEGLRIIGGDATFDYKGGTWLNSSTLNGAQSLLQINGSDINTLNLGN